MGFIKDLINRSREKKERLAEFELQDRVVSQGELKKKSHNERELLKILEHERQEAIKEALRYEEKRRVADEKFKARQMLKFNPNQFRNESMLKQKRDFLRGGNF